MIPLVQDMGSIILGTKASYDPIELPKGYNKVIDLLKGASLRFLVRYNTEK